MIDDSEKKVVGGEDAVEDDVVAVADAVESLNVVGMFEHESWGQEMIEPVWYSVPFDRVRVDACQVDLMCQNSWIYYQLMWDADLTRDGRMKNKRQTSQTLVASTGGMLFEIDLAGTWNQNVGVEYDFSS